MREKRREVPKAVLKKWNGKKYWGCTNDISFELRVSSKTIQNALNNGVATEEVEKGITEFFSKRK